MVIVPQNDKGQIPADVVPDPVDMPLEMADAAASAKEVKQMLLDAVPLVCDLSNIMLPNYDNVTGKDMLESLGLKLGDRVVIAGQKVCLISKLWGKISWIENVSEFICRAVNHNELNDSPGSSVTSASKI